jgi:hypothetical protein
MPRASGNKVSKVWPNERSWASTSTAIKPAATEHERGLARHHAVHERVDGRLADEHGLTLGATERRGEVRGLGHELETLENVGGVEVRVGVNGEPSVASADLVKQDRRQPIEGHRLGLATCA